MGCWLVTSTANGPTKSGTWISKVGSKYKIRMEKPSNDTSKLLPLLRSQPTQKACYWRTNPINGTWKGYVCYITRRLLVQAIPRVIPPDGDLHVSPNRGHSTSIESSRFLHDGHTSTASDFDSDVINTTKLERLHNWRTRQKLIWQKTRHH